jgi:RNA polymerase sigma-70 factor (ECF subfamily)
MSERYLDDSMLIQRSQAGDRSAFDSLINKHSARAYQYAFRLTHNIEEAADVVGDAFVRVHNALPNFKGQSAFTTWLYRILTNCYLDIRKKERNRQTLSLDVAVQSGDGEVERQIEDTRKSPFEESVREARETTVESALDEMPDYQRAMIVMYHVEMLSYEEISAALDLPLGTVKSRLNRARISLRDVLMRNEELFLSR